MTTKDLYWILTGKEFRAKRTLSPRRVGSAQVEDYDDETLEVLVSDVPPLKSDRCNRCGGKKTRYGLWCDECLKEKMDPMYVYVKNKMTQEEYYRLLHGVGALVHFDGECGRTRKDKSGLIATFVSGESWDNVVKAYEGE